MSGVFGLCGLRTAASYEKMIMTMGQSMVYRDWYVVDTHVDTQHDVAIGRISIGVFNKPSQPVWNEDRTCALMWAGEFYAVDSGDVQIHGISDEQLALRLYDVYGPAFVRRLEGVFVITIYDVQRQEIVIVNDRHGLYPLHYSNTGGGLIFAPELKAIVRALGDRPALNMTAVAEYLRFQVILGDKTFFEGIRLLPNASILRFKLASKHLTIETYWDFSQLPASPATLTFVEAVEQGSTLLRKAVRKRTKGDYRLGVYVSGGVDARAILGYIEPERFPVNTLTYGLRGCRDVVYGEMIAQRAGGRHHYFEFRDGTWVRDVAELHVKLTEGAHSWIHSHGLSIAHHARELMDVNLNGYGGGSLDWEDPSLFESRDDLTYLWRIYYLLSQEFTWRSLDDLDERFLYAPGVRGDLEGVARESLRQELRAYEALDYTRRTMAISFQTDRRMFQYYTVFNRSHVEQRFPFMDYQYLDFVRALPPEMEFKRKLRRAIILRDMPHLAAVPYDKDDLPITGSQLRQTFDKAVRKGRSALHAYLGGRIPVYSTLYADYENWLRGELREWGEEILFSGSLEERGLFDMAFVRSLWNRHQSGREVNFIGKIAPIMTLEMVLRFFDKMPD